MRRNPARRLQQEMDRRAGVVAATAEAQASPAASVSAALNVGATDPGSGDWVGLGRLNIDPIQEFRLG
jgi:hypothetical protein